MEHIYVNILKKNRYKMDIATYYQIILHMNGIQTWTVKMDDRCVEHMQTMMDVGRYVLGLLTVTGG